MYTQYHGVAVQARGLAISAMANIIIYLTSSAYNAFRWPNQTVLLSTPDELLTVGTDEAKILLEMDQNSHRFIPFDHQRASIQLPRL